MINYASPEITSAEEWDALVKKALYDAELFAELIAQLIGKSLGVFLRMKNMALTRAIFKA